ncbi:MAG: integrin alpha, partial [Pseudomonadota bacterium]
MSAQPTRWTATLSGAVRQALRLPGYPLLCAAAAGGLLGAAPHTHADNAFPAEFDLSQLLDANGGDGSEGVVIETIPNANAGLGAAAGGGDVNGDDVDDLILGAAGSSFSAYNGGQAFVLFGSRDPLPAEVELKALLTAFGGDGSEGMVLNSTYGSYYGSQNVGAGVGNVGDVNGDGIGDFLVGAPVRVFRGGSPGEGYLIYGTADGFPAEIAVPFQDVLPTVASTRINAIGEGRFGETVSSAGDVNGDGIVDLVAGAPSASQYYSQVDRSGTTLVLFGGDQNFPSAFSESDVINADGAIGAVFRGIDWAGYDGDESGTDVAGDGDINGDGLDDIVIGAPYADRGDASRAGEAYIVFGRRQGPVGPGPFDGEETLANLLPENGGDGSRGVVLSGTFANEKTGRRVSIIGDVNADGFDDIAIEFISSADSPPV